MMQHNHPQHKPHQADSLKNSLNAGIEAVVYVETATAIIHHPDDPYRILVGDSEKHPTPVLPGGKLESYEEGDTTSDTPGLDCIKREVEEEIGTALLNPVYIGKANDPDRDVRIVPAKKLAGARTTPTLEDAGIEDTGDATTLIEAHYGTPDYLYVGTVDPDALKETEELKGIRFIDVRNLQPGDLSAGHDLVAFRYKEMLESGANRLSDDALTNFEEEKLRFAQS